MKRIIAAALTLLLLAGCAGKGESASGEIRKEPPALRVERDGEELRLRPGTWSWEWTEKDGTVSGIEACGPGPLELSEDQALLPGSSDTARLRWDTPPREQTLLVYRMSDRGDPDAMGEKTTVNEDGDFPVEPGCIYSLHARWENGDAWYAFQSPIK